jgi:altronate dehydratase small subunit
VKPNVIVINPKDNVAIALEDIQKGENVCLSDGRKFAALTDIPYSHKVALMDIALNAEVIKYGEIIGEAKELITKGGWVHSHNLDIKEKKGR